MIRYGIGFDYLPDWGVREALREVYQNFNDFGDFTETVTDSKQMPGYVTITLQNEYAPKNFEFLRVGNSGKRNDNTKVGEHGEGLKMAMLVLHRRGYQANVMNRLGLQTPVKYTDPMLGECFGIKNDLSVDAEGFAVGVRIPIRDWERFRTIKIDKSEVIYDSMFYGQILDKEAGAIYVGGTYVCTLPDYNFSYNFNPEDVNLDRDRKVPSSYDVRYYANRLQEEYIKNVTLESLSTPEFSGINNIPRKVAEKFQPKAMGGSVELVAKTIVADRSLKAALMKHPVIAKRVTKLKASLIRKVKPLNLLKDFIKQHGTRMTSLQKTDFNALIIKAKDWK